MNSLRMLLKTGYNKCALTRGVVVTSDDEHVESFSDQWDRWAHTQVDSYGYKCGYTGCNNSEDIFFLKTGLAPADLRGRVILDAGCGVGRFSEIAAKHGARVIAIDLSRAVFHAAKLGKNWKQDALFVKGNLEDIPLLDQAVDIAFSIGVLHHTSNPERALRELVRVTKTGGIVAGWVYAKNRTYGSEAAKKWRTFTSDPANREWVLKWAEMAPVLREIGLKEWSMLAEVVGVSCSKNDEECCLDVFDWLTPQFQFQYTWEEWNAILSAAGLKNIQKLSSPQSWRATRP